jgi:hypothetical protein
MVVVTSFMMSHLKPHSAYCRVPVTTSLPDPFALLAGVTHKNSRSRELFHGEADNGILENGRDAYCGLLSCSREYAAVCHRIDRKKHIGTLRAMLTKPPLSPTACS